MRRGRAGRGDREIQPLDLEEGGDTGRHGGRHAARHHIGADTFRALFAGDVEGLHHIGCRGATRPGDQPGARVRYLVLAKAGIGDGLLHGQHGICSALSHEAKLFAINMRGNIHLDGAVNLAAKSQLGIFRCMNDARAARTKRVCNLGDIVADRRYDTDAGNGDAAHDQPSSGLNRPTRMSLASKTVSPSQMTRPSAMPMTSRRMMTRFISIS